MDITSEDFVFPYLHLYYRESEIVETFVLLKNFRHAKVKKSIFHLNLDFETTKKFLILSDYFTNDVRMNARFLTNPSPVENFSKDREKIIEKLGNKPEYKDLDFYIWKNYPCCSTFPVVVAREIFRYFKPKKILDPSAGWGDRMIAAASCDIEYTGVDPNMLLIPGYEKIKKVFKLEKEKYKLVSCPFEDFNTKEKFNLIFTSPPFYDMEIYTDEETQSCFKFKSYDEWREKFFRQMILKSIEFLTTGGHLLVYVNNTKKYKLLDDLKTATKDIKSIKFKGFITWINGKYPKKISVYTKN